MTFNSYEFAVFLPLVLLAYRRLSHRGQNRLLLIASYLFYGAWDYRFLGLLALTTVIDHVAAHRLHALEAERARRRWLVVSIASNLAILGCFKYFDFFVASGASLLEGFGLHATTPTLRVLLPVGISFYTFQSMSYTLDVFRRRIEPVRGLLDFALYVAYFPQLVAGPIERARYLLPQILRPRAPIDGARIRSALVLILIGFFRKIVIADALAPYVDQTFGSAATAGWMQLLIGIVAFALQIYGDFAGYSDIARGTSRLFGIELMVNFRQPYLSRNITAFWRTWHISLSTWLRDYLYVPLGGNRSGRARTYRNLMVTMLLGGLWHGASWTFVVWGALHGSFLIVHKLLGGRPDEDVAPRFRMTDIAPTAATFGAVCFAWIFFRASSFAEASSYISGIVGLRPGAVHLDALMTLLIVGTFAVALDVAQRNADSDEVVLRWSAPARGVAFGTIATALLIYSGANVVPFIYFQF